MTSHPLFRGFPRNFAGFRGHQVKLIAASVTIGMQRMCHALARGLFTFPRPLIFSHGPNLFVYVLGRPCERFISTLPNNVILLFRGFPYEFCGFLTGSLGQVHRCECYYSLCRECATPLLGVPTCLFTFWVVPVSYHLYLLRFRRDTPRGISGALF